jgi:hypothetical protein
MLFIRILNKLARNLISPFGIKRLTPTFVRNLNRVTQKGGKKRESASIKSYLRFSGALTKTYRVMKKSVLLCAMLIIGACPLKAQLTDVIVEVFGTSGGSYPAGHTTYRVYARLEDPTDFLSAVYGIGAAPSDPDHTLTLGQLPGGENATTIWNSSFGGITGPDINPAFCGVFPETCFDSFITIGRANSTSPGNAINVLTTPMNLFSPGFGNSAVVGTPVAVNDGAWFALSGDVNGFPTGADNRVLIMQMTVPTGSLAYAINIQIHDEGVGTNSLYYAHTLEGPIGEIGGEVEIDYSCAGLVYPNDCGVDNFGCMDVLACNYSPLATINVDCVYPGCTDWSACNFDPISGCDDGSCTYPGCTDPESSNFNPFAGCDDGSCTPPSACNDPAACNYDEAAEIIDNAICCYSNCLTLQSWDVFGDSWNGALLSIFDSQNTLVYSYTLASGLSGTASICLSSGCYSIEVSLGTWPLEVSWQLDGVNSGVISGGAGFSGSFSVGVDSPCGCTDPTACNFSELAIINDGSCLYNDACWGCMDTEAVNYDDIAIWDDGSCQYTISAIVFYDTNGNGIWEMNEPGLEGWSAYVPEVNATLFTDENGYFYLAEFAPGDYSLELTSTNPDWTNTTPLTQTVTIPNAAIAAEFGFVPTGTAALFEVNTYSSMNIIGCVNGVDLGIWLENDGAVPLNGTFTLTFDPTLTTSNTTGFDGPDQVGAGNVTWNISNQPIGVGTMYAVHINGPGFEDINQTFEFVWNLTLNDNGDEYYNNTWSQDLTVACSYDPNDKQANPIGYAEPHFILGTERIEYTIRFQNTGNYPAEDILITDQLDMSVLDISTFELNYGTLPFYTCLHDDGLLEFMFVDVYLPDSVNNEPESHGLVSFSIEPLNGLPPGTVINNTAEIYFDQNPAVTTNTTYHTLFNCESFVGITGNLELCEGEGTILSAEQDYVESYSWSINDEIIGSTSIIGLNNLAATDYSVSVYVENPLCGAITVENLLVHPAPLVNAGDDLELCYLQTAELNASSTLDGDFTWNNGLGSGAQQSFVAETSATYEISVTTEFGCSGADDVDVIVHELPGITISQNGDILTAPDGTSWQWFLGEEPIQGATAQEYEVLQDGSYSVLTTNEFGCSAGSEAVFVVGIKDPSAGEFVIYPNPASDHLIIQAPLGTWVFKLFNCIGQEIDINPISDGNVYSVDVSFLDSGTYQLLIMCSKTSVSTRISIK